MVKILVTSKGNAIQIGQQLGKGGEGAVFEVPGLTGQVAKLYHHQPDLRKQAKLSFMAASADQQLLDYVAWPQETLHASRGQPVLGFLMPKVTGKEPIHAAYSPAHRRRERPNAGWDWLLFVARNTAAAFEALHSHGHVLGDVNQGNVLVGSDSKVMLIDADSFQINAKGTLYLCEVAVPHFVPPELQGISSFDGVTRSANHDNFGLALLIFHLLFGGRHPYSGVPIKVGAGEALETDIKSFRYAYARDNQVRGLAPPPNSIPLGLVPDAMEFMFALSFTENGAKGGRPTAKQWVAALDALRGRIKKCSANTMHMYPDHLQKCPWCALEQQGVSAYFVNLGATFTATPTGFVLTQVFAVIEAVQPPQVFSAPNINSHSVTPRPLPDNIPGNTTIGVYRFFIVAAAVGLLAAAPQVWFLALLGAGIGWAIAGSAGADERSAERTLRSDANAVAEKEFQSLVDAANREVGPDGFTAKKAELVKLRDEYLALDQTEVRELTLLSSNAQELQKKRFLEGFFIDQADISGVGPGRKAALRSFGIETAADVSANRVRQIKGFGDSLTRAVVDWKSSCERKFKFNPNTAVTAADKNAVRARFGSRKLAIENSLKAGAAELQRFSQMAASKRVSLLARIEPVAQKVAQTRADLELL
jgi:DNA-binding helix-hairpin-helix protein with protein kinase domain